MGAVGQDSEYLDDVSFHFDREDGGITYVPSHLDRQRPGWAVRGLRMEVEIGDNSGSVDKYDHCIGESQMEREAQSSVVVRVQLCAKSHDWRWCRLAGVTSGELACLDR
jgi:hypothetical protein